MVSPLPADSAPSPNGSQFQVNTYTTSFQEAPAVASDSAGNFVVVWQSYGSPGTATSGWSVQAQRYSAGGSAVGGQFQVDTETSGYQRFPSVASDPAGDFFVVWQSQITAGAATNSVQGQRYDASGTTVGEQFQVNTYTTNGQYYPSVASDSHGNFVVVWSSNGSPGSDTSGTSVQGQRYKANGAAVGAQFQVNTYTTSDQSAPVVASDPAGNLVVVWQSNGSAGSDTSGTSVQGQRYDASGAPVGGQFQVNTYTTNNQNVPALASDSKGNFAVVWESHGSAGGGTAGYSVQGQRYDASGAPVGGQFQVNTYTTGNQQAPLIVSDSFGDFVVVWDSYGSSGTDTSSTSVQAQIYGASGAALGGQFQVNTYTTNAQYTPSVASDSIGRNFVVAWTSIGSAGTDIDHNSVQGQRYLPEPPFVPSIGAIAATLLALARRRQRMRPRRGQCEGHPLAHPRVE